MIKHHRYGTGYLIEAGENVPDVTYDIGRAIPATWHKIAELPVPEFDKTYDLNITARLVLKALGAVPMPLYLVGKPAAGTPPRLVLQIQHPSSFLQFKEYSVEATKDGHPPSDFRVFLGGPSDDDVADLIDKAYVQLKALADKKTTAENVQRAMIAAARAIKPVVLGMYHFGIKPDTSRVITTGPGEVRRKKGGWTRTTSYPSFDFVKEGDNFIGHVGQKASSPIRPDDVIALTKAKSDKMKQREFTKSLQSVLYQTLWARFHRVVLLDPKGIRGTFEAALNAHEVSKAYSEATNQPNPQTDVSTKNTSRESGPNKNLFGDARVIKRGPIGPRQQVSGSIRGTSGDIGSIVVSANPAERQWQNAQGYYVTPDPLPTEVGQWIPAERINPLVRGTRYMAFFGIFYDHPLLRPSSSGQPYWYSSRSHFIRAAEQYAMMTGDHPNLMARIIPLQGNRAGLAITERELKTDATRAGLEFRTDYEKLKSAFHGAIKTGLQKRPALVHKKLGPEAPLKQSGIPSNPITKHPPGIKEKDWLNFVNWIRREGEKVLGLKFGAGRSAMPQYTEYGGKKYRINRSQPHLQSLQAIRKNKELTGERDEQGKPVEPFALYLIEFLEGHTTNNRDFNTFMVPINVIRADEELPPRRKLGKITKQDYLDQITQQFMKFGVTTRGWRFIPANLQRPFSFALIHRLSHATPGEQNAMNQGFKHVEKPKIQRTEFGYKIDGVHWNAHQMIVAMPPKTAEKHFGFIGAHSYSRLLQDDPDIVNRVKRAVGKKGESLRDFGLLPQPIRTEFFGNPYGRRTAKDTDPTFGVHATGIPHGFWESKMGQRWEATFKHHFNDVGRYVDTLITGFQRANSFEDNAEAWTKYIQNITQKEGQLGQALDQSLQDMQNGGTTSTVDFGPGIGRKISTYIRWVERVVMDSSGAEIKIPVPTIVEGLGLSVYTAPIMSFEGRTVHYSVKAPSEDIARTIICLKLLRSSKRNKTLGRVLAIKSPEGIKIVPDMHAQFLAQWASTGFIVYENQDVKGLRFQLKSRPLTRAQMKRTGPHGNIYMARMLRTD